MSAEDFWLPLVDEPIGEFVAELQREDEELAALVASPRRQLAFRTFAYIRVGVLLGSLLVDYDVQPEGSRTWVDELLADPKHRAAVIEEVKAVAQEVAADPKLAEEEPVGPDEEARERFRRFAKELD
jgi:ferric-dicitrate binding protein FerR (iron transport regulator)